MILKRLNTYIFYMCLFIYQYHFKHQFTWSILMLPWDVLRAGSYFNVKASFPWLSYNTGIMASSIFSSIDKQYSLWKIICDMITFIYMYISTVRTIYYPYLSPHISYITRWSDISGAGMAYIAYHFSGGFILKIRKEFKMVWNVQKCIKKLCDWSGIYQNKVTVTSLFILPPE